MTQKDMISTSPPAASPPPPPSLEKELAAALEDNQQAVRDRAPKPARKPQPRGQQ